MLILDSDNLSHLKHRLNLLLATFRPGGLGSLCAGDAGEANGAADREGWESPALQRLHLDGAGGLMLLRSDSTTYERWWLRKAARSHS